MKRSWLNFFGLFLVVFGWGFICTAKSPSASYGKALSEIPADAAEFSGKVTEVCKKKGCWMEVADPSSKDGAKYRVTFKDYGFFVPSTLEGKQVRLKGIWEETEVSIKDQKHYLKDANRPQSEIDAVVSPKKERRFVAAGVEVLD